MKKIVSAVFEDQMQAEQALQQLRANGVPDSSISVVAQHPETIDSTGGVNVQDADDHDNKGSGLAKGAAIGAGTGALFGLAAFFIPGIGPFVTAGALANALGYAGGAAVSGAIVGGTAGGLAGVLMDYGVDKDDAEYYQERIGQGGVFVAVDTAGSPQNEDVIRQVLQSAGGRSSAYMA
ncbi:MAG: hypothetical protein QOJ65_1534 [Fimbriimonadaceae bacterium]|jgi:hypothetical protein|nr:hypothetical protein [Fimbriimonadaceae bacterium]